MATLSDTGLETIDQDTIKRNFEATQRSGISNRLDQSESSPLGQLNAIFSRAVALGEEGLAALYASMDEAGASGEALDRLCALTGTSREPASHTRVTATVNVNPGTYAAGDLVAHVNGRPEDRFENAEAVTNGGGSAASVSAVFVAQTAGPVQCPAGELEAIASPVVGWNSITNALAGAVGQAQETDAQLRLRRRAEVARAGSGTVNGIGADILEDVDGVISVVVRENATAATVDSIPAYGVEAVVFGPTSPTADDNDAVAEAIFNSLGAGTPTYGNTTRNVTDDYGVTHAINFTRPTAVPTDVSLSFTYLDETYEGDAAVAAKIAEKAVEVLVSGRDVAFGLIVAWLYEVTGVLAVTDVEIDSLGSFTNKTITARQYATIAEGDITITSTPGTP